MNVLDTIADYNVKTSGNQLGIVDCVVAEFGHTAIRVCMSNYVLVKNVRPFIPPPLFSFSFFFLK